jgi:glycosyltransferase involved in cell wall biosynthesis
VRIVFFSERLAPPFDEGIKNVAANLLRQLRDRHDILALTTAGSDIPELGVRNLPRLSRHLWDAPLRARIRQHRPERIVYLPTASMTLFSFLRAAILRGHGQGAPTTLIALQPRAQTWVGRLLVPLIAPERVVVQSRASAALLAYLGQRVRFAPAGVDLERFSPASVPQRHELRLRYGIDADARVILHAGHINRNRNVAVLKSVQAIEKAQTVLVGSTSTPQDVDLVAELRRSGVRVVTEYQMHMEDWYRLADVYLFPASPESPPDQMPAIEVPLSVLEAMACDLPVVTTRFGGLPALFEERAGLHYVDDAHEDAAWRDGVREALRVGAAHTRAGLVPLSWSAFADAVIGNSAGQEGGADSLCQAGGRAVPREHRRRKRE